MPVVSVRLIETPMSLAASLSDPRSMMLTLVEAGAYLDFRNSAGQTAMHRAAKLANDVALQVITRMTNKLRGLWCGRHNIFIFIHHNR